MSVCRYCSDTAPEDGNRICAVCFMAESDDAPECEMPGCETPSWECGEGDGWPFRNLCADHASEAGYCYACGNTANPLTPTREKKLCDACIPSLRIGGRA
jgi:hypothetical protein